MFLGIDHLVIAVADPDDAAAQLEADLGLEATGGGRHAPRSLGRAFVGLNTRFRRPVQSETRTRQ
jgi:hypothetical protein